MDDDTGERSLARVGMLARVALVLAVVGGVIGGTASRTRVTPQLWVGGLVALAGVVTAVGCLVHGARHDHERGRWVAVAALLLGFFGLVVMLIPVEGRHGFTLIAG